MRFAYRDSPCNGESNTIVRKVNGNLASLIWEEVRDRVYSWLSLRICSAPSEYS